MHLLQRFVPDLQPSTAVQPGAGALHDPAAAPQPLARVHPPRRDAGLDASAAPHLAPGARVIGLVRRQRRGAPSRSASPRPYRRNGINGIAKLTCPLRAALLGDILTV